MNNKTNIIVTLLFAASCAFVSCDDWTDVESIGIKQPGIEEQNPELYTKYLENLRQYKADTEHKKVYAWFDNSEKNPFTRAQHLTDLPDSLDAVVLMHPENLVERELQEIESIRSNKNTKVIYSISFDEIKTAYNQATENEEEAEPKAQDFLSYMVDTLQYALSIADKYDYDGISIGYVGKSILHMTEAEKNEYKQNEKAFIGIMDDWFQRHQEHMIIFEGNPQNLINKELLAHCSVVFVSCFDVNSAEKLTFNLQLAAVENVPIDKLGVIIPTASPDESNKETGYFDNGTKILAGVAEWALSVDNIDIAGLGIYNVSNDYYNPSMTFKETRNAITTLNPSIKN